MAWAIAVCALAATVAAHGATGLADIRVHSVQPELFEYRFTSVVSSGERPLLSFNHLGGRTLFVRVGDELGPYTVQAFEPRTEKRFNPRVNTTTEVASGVVTLAGADGATVTLEMGKPLPRPGQVACLVSMDTGGWQYTREGDELSLNDRPVQVAIPDQQSVHLTMDGTAHTVAWLTDAERSKLEALWEGRRREQADRLARARRDEAERQAQAEVDAMLAAPQMAPRPTKRLVPVLQVHSPARSSRMFAGTEYRYPAEFEVIPIVTPKAGGGFSVSGITVPTRFETRRTGMGIRAR